MGRHFPTVKFWKTTSLAFSPENIDLNPGSLSSLSSPLSVSGLGFGAQALGSCLGVHSPGIVWALEMSHSHKFWELLQMPGDNALKKPMKEQQLPHQLQDARYVFYLEKLHFGVLKGINFSKNVQAAEKHFFTEMKVMYKYI